MSGATVLFDAPGPRARVRHWILAGLTIVAFGLIMGWLIWKFAAAGQFTVAKWEPFLTANLWTTYVLPGVKGTLTAAAASIAVALVLGCLLGVGRLSPIRAVSWSCATFVEFFRAVPVLIMMLFSYALFAMYNVFPSEYLALAGVITGLSLYNAAVIAEIVRSGVHSLPRGQAEAASALGMTWSQTMGSIQLPQAITSMLPVLVSQMVVVLKDTAIGYQITFVEMVRQGQNLGSAYTNTVPALMVIAALMIGLNFALSFFATRLEARLRRSKKGPAPQAARASVEDDPGD